MKPISMAKTSDKKQTIITAPIKSSRFGQVTLASSARTSLKKVIILLINIPQEGFTFKYCAGLAGQEGFEPPTRGFGVRCSTNWSYWP
jgi:hypothetical protein